MNTENPPAAQAIIKRRPVPTIRLDLDKEYLTKIRAPLTRALALASMIRLACLSPDVEREMIAEAMDAVEQDVRDALGIFRPILWALEGKEEHHA
jgi:hypothetical protein